MTTTDEVVTVPATLLYELWAPARRRNGAGLPPGTLEAIGTLIHRQAPTTAAALWAREAGTSEADIVAGLDIAKAALDAIYNAYGGLHTGAAMVVEAAIDSLLYLLRTDTLADHDTEEQD